MDGRNVKHLNHIFNCDLFGIKYPNQHDFVSFVCPSEGRRLVT